MSAVSPALASVFAEVRSGCQAIDVIAGVVAPCPRLLLLSGWGLHFSSDSPSPACLPVGLPEVCVRFLRTRWPRRPGMLPRADRALLNADALLLPSAAWVPGQCLASGRESRTGKRVERCSPLGARCVMSPRSFSGHPRAAQPLLAKVHSRRRAPAPANVLCREAQQMGTFACGKHQASLLGARACASLRLAGTSAWASLARLNTDSADRLGGGHRKGADVFGARRVSGCLHHITARLLRGQVRRPRAPPLSCTRRLRPLELWGMTRCRQYSFIPAAWASCGW